MLVKFFEVFKKPDGQINLREIYLNTNNIVSVREEFSQQILDETKRLGLMEESKFSRLSVSEGASTSVVTVVGCPQNIYSKVRRQKKVLKG